LTLISTCASFRIARSGTRPAARVECTWSAVPGQRVQVAAFPDRRHLSTPASRFWTESSYKYRLDDLGAMLGRTGFRVTDQWHEAGFALTLAEAG